MLKTALLLTFTCTFIVFCAKTNRLQAPYIAKTMHIVMTFVHIAFYFKLFRFTKPCMRFNTDKHILTLRQIQQNVIPQINITFAI